MAFSLSNIWSKPNTQSGVIGSSILIGLILLFIMLVVIPVHATGETFTSVGNKTTTYGTPINLSDLQIQDSDADSEMTIRLYAPSGGFNFDVTDGLSISGDNANDRTITGLRSDINTALTSATYTPSQPGSVTIEARIGAAAINPYTHHAYLVVPAGEDPETDKINWTNAKTAAEGMTYGGVSGYLATITSPEEDSFIQDRINGDGWIGASDSAIEGQWRWITGPEALADSGNGLLFWTGNYSGTSTPGLFENWSNATPPGEPNNSASGDGEDCAQLRMSQGGAWNDLQCTTTLPYYIVEFGTDENPPAVPTESFTVTTNTQTRSIGSCADLMGLNSGEIVYDTINLTADIDCVEEDTLYNDSILAKSDYDTFHGTFDGKGHKISNVALSAEGGPLGIFGYAEGATFKDLTLENIDYGAGGYAGALVGEASNTNFTNIQLNNVVIGAGNRAGALAGFVNSGLIENVHATNVDIDVYNYGGGLVGEVSTDGEGNDTMTVRNASVSGGSVSGQGVGGLIGHAEASSFGGTLLIEKVYSDVDVTSDGSEAGGLIGTMYSIVNGGSSTASTSVTLRNAYSWSSVSASEGYYIGSLIGTVEARNSGSGSSILNIQNTYASGAVDGFNNVAGLFGYLWIDHGSEVEITNNFAKGRVTVYGNGSEYGGLVGEVGGNAIEDMTSTGNYYDQSGTDQADCSPEDSLAGCTAVNADNAQPRYFINNNTSAPMNAWDFETIWVKNPGIPPVFGTRDDSDGITVEVENAGPNDGDANNDGALDSRQNNVASLVDPVTGNYAVLEVDEQCDITSISILAEDTDAKDAGYDYPAGLMDFTIDCGEEGFTATVEQYYYGISGRFIMRKYNPDTKIYTPIEDASVADQTIAGGQVKVASYQVTDGEELDLDGEANGVIEDPAGLAQAVNSNGLIGNLASTGTNVWILLALAFATTTAGGVWLTMQRKSL